MTHVIDNPLLQAKRRKAVPTARALRVRRTTESTGPTACSPGARLSRSLVALTALFGLLLVPSRIVAAEAAPTEYQVKAAYLFNFVKYVEWPASAFHESASPFVIGVLGHDLFGADLDKTIAGRSINNRPIVVRRLAGDAEAKQCHILFISTSEKARFEKILGTLQGLPILTVADTDPFLDLGGVIDFVTRDNKVRFRANLNSARANQLKISSRLLSVADTVIGKLEGGQP